MGEQWLGRVNLTRMNEGEREEAAEEDEPEALKIEVCLAAVVIEVGWIRTCFTFMVSLVFIVDLSLFLVGE